MPKIDVEEQLKLRFLQPLTACMLRRVVIWHDADGEFAPEFERLAAEGFDGAGADDGVMPAHGDFERPVRFVEACEGCMFAVKKLINRDDLANDILLYRRCPRGRLEGDWLADVELYADQFQADYLSLLADQLGIENIDAVRESLREHKTFFDAKTRCVKFAACVPHASGASDIELGILTVIFGGKEVGDARPAFVLRGCMTTLLHEGPEALAELVDKYCVRDVLAAFIVRCYGFEGPLYKRDSLLALASHVLITASSTALPEGALKGLESYVAPAYGPYCLEAVRTWDQTADARASSEDLFEICRLVEDARGLFARFEALSIDVLTSLDVFPCVNEAVLSQLFCSFAQGADRVADARAFAARRCDLSWYRRVESYFDLLVAVADMCAFRQAHAGGFHLAQPQQVWDAYTSDWYAMDAAYRHMCTAYLRARSVECDVLEEPARAVVDWAENLYSNWFLADANACWATAAQGEWADCGYIEGPARQDEFYWHVLPTFVGSTKTTVVIVSDALRYEVARDVAALLERERGGNVKVSSMQAVFSSITEVGMPALLPHQALKLAEDGSFVLADGMPTATTPQREAVLTHVESTSRALRSSAYLNMAGTERKALLKDSKLVYLYHNKIDATGEKAATQDDVFDACADTVEELATLARRVCTDAPGARVVITADHGFIYTRRELNECQMLGKPDLPFLDAPVMHGKRHLVVPNEAVAKLSDEARRVFVNVDMGRLGAGFEGFAPRENVHFKRPGGTNNYVHGGMSLQELCVPVIGFWRARSGSKDFVDTRAATLRVLSEGRRVTNSLFSVNLIQEEPAQGKVLPCEYELVFTDASGNEVSDTVKAHANKTSVNSQERVVHAKFALRAADGFSAKGPYYLVCRERETGKIVWRETYTIAVSFTPVADFGF